MADFFEFQESDIIFSDEFSDSNQISTRDTRLKSRSILHNSKISKQENCSVPVNIPENFTHSSSSSSGYDNEFEFSGYFDDGDYDDDDDDDYDDDDGIVPPHVILDRRSSNFDSFEKIARPKNLIHVRNSILKLTGFLE